MLTEIGCLELVVGILAVEHIGGGAAHRVAENPGERVDGQRIGFLRLQRSCGGDE